MAGNSKSASLRTIAEATGVSVSTVSRVLSGRDNVNAKTRDRVLGVSRLLKYRPNLLVRGIQTGRTGMIGVIIRPTTPFATRLLAGVHDTLGEADCVPIVLWTPPGTGEGGPRELEQIHRLVDRRVDGIILSPVEDTASDAYLHEIWDREIPLVTVDRELEFSRASHVGCDDSAAGHMAADALLQLGHRRLGHIAGPSWTSTGRQRREGFVAAVAEAPEATVAIVEEPSFVEGTQVALELLKQPDRPTAVFAANNSLVLGVYRAAEQLGLRIPEDLSVIGCGDPSILEYAYPTFAMIDQRAYDIGTEAARLLMQSLTPGDAPSQRTRRILQPTLVKGSSFMERRDPASSV